MWVRTLGKRNLGLGVVLPSEALRSLGWERGDFVRIEMTSAHELLLTKFNPVTVPDRASAALEPLPQIVYV